MTSKGQALVEAIACSLLLCGLFIFMLKGAYFIWAGFVVDRETHRMVLCGLTNLETRRCEFASGRELRRLLKWGQTQRLDLRLSHEAGGVYSSSGTIHFQIFGLAIRSQRRLNESDLNKASRRWRF